MPMPDGSYTRSLAHTRVHVASFMPIAAGPPNSSAHGSETSLYKERYGGFYEEDEQLGENILPTCKKSKTITKGKGSKCAQEQ